jgi:hypothetical protein
VVYIRSIIEHWAVVGQFESLARFDPLAGIRDLLGGDGLGRPSSASKYRDVSVRATLEGAVRVDRPHGATGAPDEDARAMGTDTEPSLNRRASLPRRERNSDEYPAGLLLRRP